MNEEKTTMEEKMRILEGLSWNQLIIVASHYISVSLLSEERRDVLRLMFCFNVISRILLATLGL